MYNNKTIVITSVNKPTKAVLEFVKKKEYSVIVVGDEKTPREYECEEAIFLPYNKKNGFGIEKVLPLNHYCRKMIGYVYAIQNGSNLIIDTDDDNIPYENYSFPKFDGKFDIVSANDTFINIYIFFTSQKVWPRGLPLDFINKCQEIKQNNEDTRVGIWQGLADGDPDVDAIYRLTNNTPCYFNKEEKNIVLNNKTISPFNSQNTAFRKEMFPLLYLPATVTFRFTDILRSFIAQPIMWLYGYKLGFFHATVFQERNQHNFMNDFISEIPMYQNSKNVVEIVQKSIKSSFSIEDNILLAYEALIRSNIVHKDEMKILGIFLNDIKK